MASLYTYPIFFIPCEVSRMKLILFPWWVNIQWEFLLFLFNKEFSSFLQAFIMKERQHLHQVISAVRSKETG